MSGYGTPSGGYPVYPAGSEPPGRRRTAGLTAVLPGVVLGLVIVLAAWAGQLWHQVNVVSGIASGTTAGGPAPRAASQGSGAANGPTAGDTAALASRVSPGLVDIDTTLGYSNAQAAGTGIVLTPDGEVLTNNHVIEGATEISATDVGTGQRFPATVVGYDRSHDIAVLALRGASGLPTAGLGDSTGAQVGDPIVAIGNAGGVGGAPSTAPGTISGLDRTVTASDEADGTAEQLTGLIQVAADVQSGDSGGPLVNAAGKIIGIDTAASTGFQMQQSGGGEGFAIPINQARAIVRQIEAGGGTPTVHIGPTAILGVQVQDAVAASGRHRYRGFSEGNVSPSSGALVSGVLAGSPAEQAGVAPGAVITSLDGQQVASTTALSDLLGSHHPGDRVDLGWIDSGGQQQSETVQLITGPAA